MAAGKVGLKTLWGSSLAILLTEAALQHLLSVFPEYPMALLGAARVLEALAVLQIARQFDKGARAIGLAASGLLQGFRRGLIWSAGIGFLTAVICAILLSVNVNPLLHIWAPVPAAATDAVLLFWVGGVISPIAEEIFFRGVLYGYLRRWGVSAAVILSTLLFALAHSGGSQIPLTQMVGGIVFAVAYELEDSLVAPITIHVLGNTAIYTIGCFLQFSG